MKYSLRTKLSLAIALIVLLSVALISLLANFFIGNQFKGYITLQQERATESIVNNISLQYDDEKRLWDVDLVHTIGMYALYDGYIVTLYDLEDKVVWSAEACDMQLCNETMNDIVHRMKMEYPKLEGEFSPEEFPAIQNGAVVGTVEVNFYGPYFLTENDFLFLKSLNKILLGIGFASLLAAIFVGILMARRLSSPIRKTVEVTRQISNGDYGVRIEEKSTTKEVSQLIASINQLAANLEKQENLRKQLTADVAHELRTPITTVQTHLEALIEGVWEPTPERLQSCYDEMARISKLVVDLESLAKIEIQNLNLDKHPISLSDLALKSKASFETQLRDKNLNMTVSGNASPVSADESRMNQVLVNLLSNAIKYTPEGGSISIHLSETEDTVILSIKDNGIGIPENEMPYIFERFYRADKSRNRLTGGTGIGLAIVKSIVTAHGGTVHVGSRLNEGSCFTITLPKATEA